MNEELRDFINELSAVRKDKVVPEARLVKDLRIDGDDGVELIVAYSKKFYVDVSNFMAADYFNPEGDPILSFLIRFLLGKPQHHYKSAYSQPS